MKKIIILSIFLLSNFSYSNYIMKFPLEVSNGGVLPNGSITIAPVQEEVPEVPENLDNSKIAISTNLLTNGKTYIGYSSGVEPTHGIFGNLLRAGIKGINGFYIVKNTNDTCELNITGTSNIVNSISTIIINNNTYSSNYIWQQPLNGSFLNRRSVNCSLESYLQGLVGQEIVLEFP